MDIGELHRQSGESNVLGEKIELRDSVPDVSFIVVLYEWLVSNLPRLIRIRTKSMMKTFGEITALARFAIRKAHSAKVTADAEKDFIFTE